MLVRDTRRPLAALMATCLALAIVASALAACSGSPDERPAPAATAKPAAPQPTGTPSPTPVATAAPTGTPSPTPAAPPSPTPVATVAPTEAPSPTAAPTPTATPTPTDEAAPAETPSATAFRYDRLDATGAVATAGSYAFLVPDGEATSVVTTYEQLRTEATVMRVNVADAHGASWAGFYDTVAVGDVVAWYEADDCWTRYRTTSTPEPVAGSSMREFGVEWFAYAGTGCAGAISTAATVSTQWDPPVIATRATGSRAVTLIPSPVRYGPYLLIPSGWKGELEPFQELWPVSPASGSSTDPLPEWPSSVLDEVRRHPLWREPVVPAGWSITGQEAHNSISLSAAYENDEHAVAIHISWSPSGPRRESVPTDVPGVNTSEARTIDGHPAVLWYDPTGALDIPVNTVSMYDEATGIEYIVSGYTFVEIEVMIAIARSFLSEATPTPTPTATAEPAPAATPSPTTFRYDTYDTTGEVTEPGSYAFLSDPADTSSAVTTYEALRDGTTAALLIHKSDAHGASQAALYDAVEAGALFEWHEADDCFVRYTVTEVRPDPAGAVPRKLLAVEWMTYAYTGCSGAISADAEVGMTWGNMLDLGGVGLRAPVVHGTHHLIPENWEGKKEALTRHDPPDRSPDDEESVATTLEAARALEFPYWREPNPLPEGWKLRRAWYGGFEAPLWGFCSVYLTEPLQFPDGKERQKGIEVCGAYNTVRKFAQKASFYADQGASPDGLIVRETRVIAGRPAVILWSPPGPNYLWNADVRIYIDDPKTETSYSITVAAPHRSDLAADGNAKLEKAIALATSLFESPSALPPPTTFRYDTYDTTGEVTEPGSYAFLADPADTTSAVTTYEALRDGTTTALLIHKSDAHGASQAALYDAVAAGDLFEWHEADDCFVRYRVTEVPAVAATAAHREFRVRPETYAWQSCQTGALPAGAAVVQFSAGSELPLDHLGGTNLAGFAVVHGVWQLTPYTQSAPGMPGAAPARVALKAPQHREPLGQRPSLEQPIHAYDQGAAARLPYWRTPSSLATNWTLKTAVSGDIGGPRYGYCASWNNAAGFESVIICGYYADVRRGRYGASWQTNHDPPRLLVRKPLVIADRPAWVAYSPLGAHHHPSSSVVVEIYDPLTETVYEIRGADGSMRGANTAPVIRIACSLFRSASECAQP